MKQKDASPVDLGQNVVNTSDEIVQSEFDAIAQNLGVNMESEAGTGGEDVSEPDESDPDVSIENQIMVGREMIGGAIILGFNGFCKYGVDDKPCFDFAENLSKVICKYYPGGYLALMDKYKEELALGMSSFVLAKAVMVAASAKREAEKEADKDKPKKTGLFNREAA